MLYQLRQLQLCAEEEEVFCPSAVRPFSYKHIWVSCFSSVSLFLLNITRTCTIKQKTLGPQGLLAPELQQQCAGGTGKMLGPTYCVVTCRREMQQSSAFQQATFLHLLTFICTAKQS